MVLKQQDSVAYLTVKPENLTKFKVGAKRDGLIVALVDEIWNDVGDGEGGRGSGA